VAWAVDRCYPAEFHVVRGDRDQGLVGGSQRGDDDVPECRRAVQQDEVIGAGWWRGSSQGVVHIDLVSEGGVAQVG
jgi:hypothetical protein